MPMKFYELADELIIPKQKLTGYALDENHPEGRHKAHLFRAALDYTVENYEELARQISDQALNNSATIQRNDQYGRHLRVDLQITGVSGQQAIVRTGWRIPYASRTAYLTTVYVIESVTNGVKDD